MLYYLLRMIMISGKIIWLKSLWITSCTTTNEVEINLDLTKFECLRIYETLELTTMKTYEFFKLKCPYIYIYIGYVELVMQD